MYMSITKTFRISSKETLAQFLTYCKRSGKVLSEAVTESMELYLTKHIGNKPTNPAMNMVEKEDRFIAGPPMSMNMAKQMEQLKTAQR